MRIKYDMPIDLDEKHRLRAVSPFFNARSLRQLNNDQFRVNTQDLLSYLIDHNGHKNKTVATLSCLPRRRSEGFVARERTRDEPLRTSAWEATP